jgi:hypothetical protein
MFFWKAELAMPCESYGHGHTSALMIAFSSYPLH